MRRCHDICIEQDRQLAACRLLLSFSRKARWRCKADAEAAEEDEADEADEEDKGWLKRRKW